MVRHPSLVIGVCFCIVLLAACSGSDTDDAGAEGNGPGTVADDDATLTPPPHDPDTAPTLNGPAAAYTILQSDLRSGEYLTDITGTYELSADTYSVSKAFASREEGYEMLTSWGYADGYETGYIPEGRERAVLNGAYYFAVESHLFEDEDGARAAFEYLRQRLAESPVTVEVSSEPVGNESNAWEAQGDPVPGSSVDSVHHRVVFRRGNLVGMVATWGADQLMSIRHAFQLARIVDEKALGERETIEPTPTTNQPADDTPVVGS